MIPPAARIRHLSPHFFAKLNLRIAELQAAGHRVIRLDEGSPDLPPAPHIIRALVSAASRPDAHAYQPHRGTAELRAAWGEMYTGLYQVDLDPEREILPLLGSKEGIFHLLQAFVDPDDVVLAPNPGYVTYLRGTFFAGGEVHPLPLLPERGYLPDFEAIPGEVLHRAKILWLNYPHNPTAAVTDLAFFTQAVEFARAHHLLVCHDAAYAQVTFDGYVAPSLLQVPGAKEVAVEFNTLSKSHNMAGWRSAALLGNADILRTLLTLKTNADSSHFLPVFEASVAALTGDQSWLQERNAIYQQRRDVIIRALHDLGWMAHVPRASLYVWCPLPPGWASEDFVTTLLEQAGVSLTPGTVFGSLGEGYVRISITSALEQIEFAMQRLIDWMGK